MKKIFTGIILLATCIIAQAPARAATVQTEIIHSQDRYQAGGTFPIIIRISIAESWYLHGPAKGESFLIPTVLSFDGSDHLKIENITFPPPEMEKFEYSDNPIAVYSGDILVKTWLKISMNTTPGEQSIKGVLSYQACNDSSCRPPENVSLDIIVPVADQSIPTVSLNQDLFASETGERETETGWISNLIGKGLWLTLLGFFVAGLAGNLTPCIYPMIPITVSYFGGKSGEGMGHPVLHGIVYILGLSATNSLLGVSAALSGSMLGAALQNPLVLIFISCVLLGLGLSFFGLWEMRMPAALTGLTSKSRSGYFGTLFMGLTIGLIATSCLGPWILALLVFVARTGDPYLGFICFFVFSIGLGLPLSILAVFSGGINRLPMSGTWMIWVRKLMGWVLAGMAAYMILPLIQVHIIKSLLMSGIAIIAGIHLGFFEKAGHDSPRFIYVKRVLSSLIALGGIAFLMFSAPEKQTIKWIEYDQTLFTEAISNSKPLILDFSAEWCVPCREMDDRVFTDHEVVTLGEKFITIKIDLTAKRPFHKGLVEKYKILGVPTILFINSDGDEEEDLRVISFVNSSDFLDRMNKLLARSR